MALKPPKTLKAPKSIATQRLSEDAHTAFLQRPCKSRTEYLQDMSETERILFDELTSVKHSDEIRNIVKYPQKSIQWYQARSARITASTSAAAVGLGNKKNRVLCQARDSIYKPFKSSAATEWGIKNEPNAAYSYIRELRDIIHATFLKQRDEHDAEKKSKEEFKSFVFRGRRIPVVEYHTLPTVVLFHFGLMIDPYNPWRGMSPDGVVVVNGIAIGCAEFKCPYGNKGDHALYPCIPKYYFPQIQSELYMCNLMWPTVDWIEFVVWNPDYFTMEPFTLDREFFFDWYAKREMRYYFEAYLPLLARQARLDFVASHSPPTETKEEKEDKTAALETEFRKFVRAEFKIPSQNRINNIDESTKEC